MSIILLIWSEWGIAILRLALGAILLWRSYARLSNLEVAEKHCDELGFRPAKIWARIDGVVYLILGAMLFLGAFTPYVSLVIVAEFVFIIIWTLAKKSHVTEADLLILASAIALATLGGGSYALDNILRFFF